MDEPLHKSDIDAVAHLVAATNAQLKGMDEHIVSESANLQASKDNWNPKGVLTDAIKSAGVTQSASPNMPVPQQVEQQSMLPPAGVHPQVQQPVMQQPVMQQPVIQPQAFITDPQILQRLDRIEDTLSKLSVTEEKIMKCLLKNNTKQITIRFDDSKDSK